MGHARHPSTIGASRFTAAVLLVTDEMPTVHRKQNAPRRLTRVAQGGLRQLTQTSASRMPGGARHGSRSTMGTHSLARGGGFMSCRTSRLVSVRAASGAA